MGDLKGNGLVLIMRELKMDDINKRIRERSSRAYLDMLKKDRKRVVRRRPRDKSEQDILDKICIETWNQALIKGKVKILSKREWYYEFD